jgi:hypothetical protein
MSGLPGSNLSAQWDRATIASSGNKDECGLHARERPLVDLGVICAVSGLLTIMKGVRGGRAESILCSRAPRRDALQQRRAGTIVPTMAQNFSHADEPKHPTQSMGAPTPEGVLSTWGLGSLSG